MPKTNLKLKRKHIYNASVSMPKTLYNLMDCECLSTKIHQAISKLIKKLDKIAFDKLIEMGIHHTSISTNNDFDKIYKYVSKLRVFYSRSEFVRFALLDEYLDDINIKDDKFFQAFHECECAKCHGRDEEGLVMINDKTYVIKKRLE